jgi:formylglycine-generating enzyme required for sulfatase activity
MSWSPFPLEAFMNHAWILLWLCLGLAGQAWGNVYETSLLERAGLGPKDEIAQTYELLRLQQPDLPADVLLYMAYKQSGERMPGWLWNRINPPSDPPAQRQGGEDATSAMLIPELSFNDTGSMGGAFELIAQDPPERPTQGGPDAAGYIWVNSLNPDGPEFEWEDITTTGTLLAVTGDDSQTSIQLPFPFPFYGSTYTTASVCSNGYVNFGPVSIAYLNTAIPNTVLPNGCIFALWDDLFVPAGAGVYYLSDPDNGRAIVQWNNVTPLGSQTTPHTFQVVMNASGLIEVRYQGVSEAQVTDCTVGIEDANGSMGLQVNLNNEGGAIADGVAIGFWPEDFFTPLITYERFNLAGSVPPAWTILSSTPTLTTPWTPVLESGSDWAVETSHPALGTAMDEWLISPVYDLSWWEDVTVGFTQQYTHANSEAAFRSSANNGLSWTTRGSFTQSTAGDTLFDISSWADGNPYARFAFRFHADPATGGSAWRVDLFWLDGVPKPPVASAPVPNPEEGEDWGQLSGSVGCRWTQPVGIRGDSLQIRVDMNGDGDYQDGGAEDWTFLPAQGNSGELDVLAPVTFAGNGLFRFELRAKCAGGRWGYSGLAGLEGPQDDWSVSVYALPPTVSSPVPPQPPAAWGNVSGSIGCTFTHPAGVDGGSLAWRLDMNRDGDYLDGGVEDWQPVEVQPHAASIVASVDITVPDNGSYAFEWKARALAGMWAYSGSNGVMGIADDWHVLVNTELAPPWFSALVPPGQPVPAWQASHTMVAGATVADSLSGVDGSSLAWRLDANRDGDFADGGLEDWQPLPTQANAPSLELNVSVALPGDGEYLLQFRARDLAGNEALSSAIRLRGDVTPPTASTLLFAGSGATAVAFQFSTAEDIAFGQYELRVSTDPVVDNGDPVWGPQQDPALAHAATVGTTLSGLVPGTGYWFQLFALDQAGNRNAGSNVLHRVVGGTTVAAVTDLVAELVPEGVRLSWTAPTMDVDGYSPVAIERYAIHASDTPWFTPSSETLVGSTTESSYLVPLARNFVLQVYYRVIVLGSGMGAPVTDMVRVEPGSFTMGPDELGHGIAHSVTLTHPFWMDRVEVTNGQYLEALQWALGQGLVTATATSVTAHGVELLDLDDIDCEIAFTPATQQFSLVARSHSTEYGGPGPAYPNGYNPARHPVKELTWYGAACYCDWRSLQAGLTPYYNGNWATDASHDPYEAEGYRLPTEAEWEYSARYNDGRPYPWGADEPIGCNWANLNCVGWTKPVGLYPQGDNALGIKDLVGNVLEFTNDRYAAPYTSETVNPIGPATGTIRACRGSDMGDAPLVYAQATTRQQYSASSNYPWIGFRTVRCEDEPEVPTCGRVVAWGDNTYGQLSIPEPNSSFVQVGTSGHHTVGLKENGTLVAWGDGNWGRNTVPAVNQGFTAISVGHCHNLALKTDGSIVSWGYNDYGQCNVPTPNSGYTAVAAGGYHSLALRADGSVIGFGQNEGGCTTVPSPNMGFVQIDTGWAHSIGLKSSGEVVVWGRNDAGENTVPSPNQYIDIAAGGGHYLALRSDGSIAAWGSNQWGQCNVPDPNTGFVDIDAEGMSSIGIKADGTVLFWGVYEANPSMSTAVPTEAHGALTAVVGLEGSVAIVPMAAR